MQAITTLWRRPSLHKLRDDHTQPIHYSAIISWILYSLSNFVFAVWAMGVATKEGENTDECLSATMRKLCIANSILDMISFLIAFFACVMISLRECMYNKVDSYVHKILTKGVLVCDVLCTIVLVLMIFMVLALGIVSGACEGYSPIADDVVPYISVYFIALMSIVLLRIIAFLYRRTKSYVQDQDDDYIWYVPKK
jgi:magnesium-transporting ATPase (P-type)